MTLPHPLLGILLGKYFGYFWFIFLGSVIPDLDHLVVVIKKRIPWSRILRSYWIFKKNFWVLGKRKINYKTKYVHSIFGAVIFSIPFIIIDLKGGLYFFGAYLLHLFLDGLTTEESEYFYPFSNKKIKGFLPNPSKIEIFFSVLLAILTIWIFKDYPLVAGIWIVFIGIVLVLGFRLYRSK